MSDTADIKQRFFNSLKCGTGEVFHILKDNPSVDFSKLIIKGAITNYAYDRQSEGSRATYIYGLIKASGQQARIIKTVLEKLEVEKDDRYGLDQMCDLAVLFLKAGNQEAKSALYNRFEKNRIEGYEFCGQDQLIEIDGLDGLLKVAETVGEKLYNDKEDWEDSWRIDNFQKQNKRLSVYKELEKVGEGNKFINAYYQSIRQNKRTSFGRKKVFKFSYEFIKEKINGNKFRFLTTAKANDLSEEEVERLANDFLNEKDKQKQEQYLRFFDKRKFPFDYQPVFEIAAGRNPRNTRLVAYASETLKHFSGKEIRQLALDKIRTKKNPCDFLCLLVNNYQKGDDKRLTEVANRSSNYDYIHSIVFGFIDIYEANATTECKEPLEAIYNKMNCGLHRESIVHLLSKNGVLSNKIFNEMQFDSYDGLRKRYKQMKKGRT